MMQPFINDGRDEQSIIRQCIWENRIYWSDVEMWIDNFKGAFASRDLESKVALVLLSKFIYYNEKEIKYLGRNLYSLFKQKVVGGYLSHNPTAHLSDAEAYFDGYLKLCRFSDMGEPSESSGYILYPFRQDNNLPITLFEHKSVLPNAIEQEEVKSLIVIDDFVGSGDTAVRFWDGDSSIQELRESDPTIDFYYLVLLAMEQGQMDRDNCNFAFLFEWLQSKQYEADAFVNMAALRRNVEFQSEPIIPSGRLIFGIPKLLEKFLSNFKNKNILIMLDEYENLTEHQQKIINTLIKHTKIPVSFRIGTRINGFKTYDTLNENEFLMEDADYRKISFEDILISKEKKYKLLLKQIAEKRLNEEPILKRKGFTDIAKIIESVTNECEALQIVNKSSRERHIQEMEKIRLSDNSSCTYLYCITLQNKTTIRRFNRW